LITQSSSEISLSYTPAHTGGKLWPSYDVLIKSSSPYLQKFLNEEYKGAPLFGNNDTWKISNKKLYDKLAKNPDIPREEVDVEKKKREKEEDLRKKALKKPSKPRKRPRKVGDTTVRDPAVKTYIMGRRRIAPNDMCESCFNKARHYTRKGKPTDFDSHHMYGVCVADSVFTTARICSICHNAITKRARDGPFLNEELKKRVILAEIPELKALISNELQSAKFPLDNVNGL